MNVEINEKNKNLEKVKNMIYGGIDLLVLPELFSTGYFMNGLEIETIKKYSEEIPSGYTTKKLIDIAKEKKCNILGTILEEENGEYYITSVVVNWLGYIGKHRKRHLTDTERMYYTCGEKTDIFDIGNCKVGALICFEGWFPEDSRELTLNGADIICDSALITNEKTFEIMKVRAIENRNFVAICNAVTTEVFQGEEIKFCGKSRLYDPEGNIVCSANEREEILLIAEVDVEISRNKKTPDCENIVKEAKKFI
jgi:predicted amidohydrolase